MSANMSLFDLHQLGYGGDKYIKGHTITILDEISVAVYMAVPENVINGYVLFSCGDAQQKQSISEATVLDNAEDRYAYCFKYNPPAKAFTEMIDVALIDDNDMVLSEYYIHPYKDYLDYIYNKYNGFAGKNGLMADLAKSIMCMSGFAQIYYDFNTDHLCNEGIDCTDILSITADDVGDYQETIVREISGFIYMGSEFSFDTYMYRMNFFIDPEIHEGDYTFYLDDEQVELTKLNDDGAYYYLEIPATIIDDFVSKHEIKIAYQNYECIITTSPLSLAHKVLTEESDENLQNLYKAIFDYYRKSSYLKSLDSLKENTL